MAQRPCTIVSGVETIEQLEQNVATIKTAEPFSKGEIKTLLSRTGGGPVGPDIEWYKLRTETT